MTKPIGSETDTEEGEEEGLMPADPAKLSTKIMQEIAERVPASKVAEVIQQLLEATFETKGGELKPDFRAREAGIKYWLSYMVGEPIKRVHTVLEKRKTAADPMADLQGSKAAMQALARLLASTPEGREALNEELGTIET